MRKVSLLLSLILTFLFLAGNSFAINLNPDTYSFPGQLENGSWQEFFFGGGPGQPGNVLSASSSSFPPQWSFEGALVSTEKIEDTTSFYEYETLYEGKLVVDSGIWGDAFALEVKATNLSVSGADNFGTRSLDFKLEMYGILDGYEISAMAAFSGNEMDNYFVFPDSHAGKYFNELSLTIASTAGEPVPEPASLILLGTGLAGLAGFGRKKFIKK